MLWCEVDFGGLGLFSPAFVLLAFEVMLWPSATLSRAVCPASLGEHWEREGSEGGRWDSRRTRGNPCD